MKNKNVHDIIGLFGLLVVIYVLFTPILHGIVHRDSGVYLYIGRKINQGFLPYKDIWDHKPLLIYYINSLGLKLGQDTVWGVWILELVSTFIAAIISYYTYLKIYSRQLAFVGVCLWILSLPLILEGGNSPEEWMLPWLFLSIYLFINYQNKITYNILLGISLAIIILLKQNIGTFPLTVIIFILIEQYQQNSFIKTIFSIFIGFSSIIIPILLYLYYQGIINDFIDQAIIYNILYSNSTLANKANSIFYGLIRLSFLSFLAFLYIISIFRNNLFSRINIFFLILLLLNFITATISGYSYPHYYLSWITTFAFLSIGKISITPKYYKQIIIKHKIKLYVIISLYLISLSIYNYLKVQHYSLPYHVVMNYITDNTINQDKVLILGSETSINFLTQRDSPTRFVYQTPLYNKFYTNHAIIEEFINDLNKNPKIIIDTRVFTPDMEKLNSHYVYNSEIDLVLQNYIKEHYSKEDIYLNDWFVYRLNE